MQQETFFTYKLYTATGPDIDVDKILGRRLVEVEQNIIWTPEQRAEIFDHIGNANQESAFKILYQIIPSSLSLPYSELTILQRDMNSALSGGRNGGPVSESSIDEAYRELVDFVVRWLHFRRLPDEKDHNSYPNEVKPYIEEQLDLDSFDKALDILKQYLDGVDDRLFADTLVVKARLQRVSYENIKGGASLSDNDLDGFRNSIRSIVKELPDLGAYVDDLLKSSEEDSSLKKLLLEFLEQGRKTGYSIEDIQRFGGKKEGFKDFQYSTIDEIQDQLNLLVSEGLISRSESTDGEIKYQFGPATSTEDSVTPAAWIFIKGTTDTEAFLSNSELARIAEEFGRRLANTDFGLLIGSWRGINAAVAKSFIQDRVETNSDINGHFKLMASSDVGLMLNSLEILSENIDLEQVQTEVRAESFANAVVLIGNSGSTEEVARSFLKRKKPVFPIVESGASDILKKYLAPMQSEQLNEIYGDDFQIRRLEGDYRDAIGYIVQNLNTLYNPGQRYR